MRLRAHWPIDTLSTDIEQKLSHSAAWLILAAGVELAPEYELRVRFRRGYHRPGEEAKTLQILQTQIVEIEDGDADTTGKLVVQ